MKFGDKYIERFISLIHDYHAKDKSVNIYHHLWTVFFSKDLLSQANYP